MNSRSLSRVLSTTSSSDPSSSRWYDERSSRFSALANTEIIGSDNTSVTSFQLSACESAVKETDGGELGTQQPLLESLLSAMQAEAHIPPRTSIESHCEETMEEASEVSEDEDIRGQVRLVSPFPARAVNGTACDHAMSIKTPTYTQLSPSRVFYQAHPEYDSEYDDDTEGTSVGSSSSLPSAFSGEKDTEDLERLGTFVSTGFPTSNLASSNQQTSPQFISPSTTTSRLSTSPIQFRSSDFGAARAAVLSDIYEEELPAAPISLEPVRAGSASRRASVVPTVAAPSPPESSTGETKIWWHCSPKRQCERSGSGHANCPSGSRGPAKAEESASQVATRVEMGSKEEVTALPPLSPSPPTPTHVKWRKRMQASSGVRKVLSVIFPCIPFSSDEKEDGGSASRKDPRASITRVRRWLTKSKPGEAANGGVVRQTSSGMLEVIVERQISSVVG